MTIGQAQNRLDGRDKVTGRARYTADTLVEGVTYGVLVGATIPKGTIETIDHRDALATPGVLRVSYEGQPVALVVADTLENATEAARLVHVDYTPAAFATDFHARLDQAEARPMFVWQPDAAKCNATATLAETNSKIEGIYATADRHHNPIESSATLAIWHDGKLTVHDTVQGVVLAQASLAQALDLDPPQIR
jgi:xanthine dehydrogenase YagR molybdenum-binding subunit